jgi:hypothetical protein
MQVLRDDTWEVILALGGVLQLVFVAAVLVGGVIAVCSRCSWYK